MIDVTLIGTGALFPLPDRALTAVLLTCGGHSILFDCGEGTQTAARKAGVSLMKTDLIALTHYHGDHILGLPGLLQTMGSMGRTAPLYITGPADPAETVASILRLTGRMPYPIRLVTLPKEGLALETLVKGWQAGAFLQSFQTEHRVPSLGYSFFLNRAGQFMPQKAQELGVPVPQWSLLQKGQTVQVGGRTVLPEQVLGKPRKGLKVVFSGDTTVCDALIAAAKDADLFICEATYGENEQTSLADSHGHMTFAQAAQTAANAGVKELRLVHYSQMITDPSAYLPNAAAFFPHTVCGQDGMKITLRFDAR